MLAIALQSKAYSVSYFIIVISYILQDWVYIQPRVCVRVEFSPPLMFRLYYRLYVYECGFYILNYLSVIFTVFPIKWLVTLNPQKIRVIIHNALDSGTDYCTTSCSTFGSLYFIGKLYSKFGNCRMRVLGDLSLFVYLNLTNNERCRSSGFSIECMKGRRRFPCARATTILYLLVKSCFIIRWRWHFLSVV